MAVEVEDVGVPGAGCSFFEETWGGWGLGVGMVILWWFNGIYPLVIFFKWDFMVIQWDFIGIQWDINGIYPLVNVYSLRT